MNLLKTSDQLQPLGKLSGTGAFPFDNDIAASLTFSTEKDPAHIVQMLPLKKNHRFTISRRV